MVKTYDITISFAGEDRPTAQAIAKSLHEDYMVRVFYDDYEQAVLWGENLTEYLLDVYKNRASYCVILISRAYVASRWARHEWRAAQARALEELDRSYILPIRLDDAELPGFLPTIGYMDPTLQNNIFYDLALCVQCSQLITDQLHLLAMMLLKLSAGLVRYVMRFPCPGIGKNSFYLYLAPSGHMAHVT